MANYRLRTIRPKAPWGAVVPAVISGISSIAGMISNNASARRQQQLAEEQLAMQKKQLGYQAESSRAQALNQVIPNMTDVYDYTKDVYANGGTVGKQSDKIIVQAGGTASTFKDKSGKKVVQFHGNTHDELNEAGGTGIYANIGGIIKKQSSPIVVQAGGTDEDINIAGKDIEVENDELESRVGNHYTIISNRLPAGNGKSLAQAVKDKDITFKQAERMQNKIKRLRTTSPVGRSMGRPRADLGATWKPIDFGLLGVQSILPFFAKKNSNRYYDKMVDMYGDFDKYLDSNANLAMPAYRSMNTDFDRLWLRGETMQQGSDAGQQIGRNTASSNTARNLMQATNTDTQAALNKILGEDQEMNYKARLADTEARNNFNASIAKMLADYRLGHLGLKAQLFGDKMGMYQRRDNDTTALIQNLSDAAYNFFNAGSTRNRQNMEDMLAMATAQGDTLDRLDTMLGNRSPKYLRDYVSKQRRLKYTTPINTSTYNYNFDINEYLKKNNGVLGRGIMR